MVDLIKLVLPLLTFFLGVAFTLWSRRGDQRRTLTLGAAVELNDAVTAWHQRIYDLRATAQKEDIDQFRHQLIDYEQNRHDLPRIIRTLEILRTDQRANELVKLGEEFLKTFTTRGPCSHACTFCYLPSEVTPGQEEALPSPSNALIELSVIKKGRLTSAVGSDFANIVLPEYLRRSDVLIQKMSREVGRLQAA